MDFMTITKQAVVEQLAAYLRHRITLDQLVDWAENAMMEGEFEEKDAEAIGTVVSRLGVADVRAFGLTWEDCEELLRQLGFSARIEIVTS
jgi:cobyrinic acid a,c-diamide synthase